MSKSTYIRLVKGGVNLRMEVQLISFENQNRLSGKQLQELCSSLGNHEGIAATPYRIGGIQALAVHFKEDVKCTSKNVTINEEEKLKIVFRPNRQNTLLEFKNPNHQKMIADLYFRNLLIKIDQSGLYKRNNSDSHRIFYEKRSFSQEGDIGAFQRYELSEVIIDGVGIGINVAIGTAFFSLKSVGQYFRENNSNRLYQLMDRMNSDDSVDNQGRERRGTLTFYAPNRIQTCYFDRFLQDESCGSKYKRTIKGVYYETLLDYYKDYPDYVKPKDAVAVVSFRNLSNVRVPADRLYVRVFNDKLSYKLAQEDKIVPQEREKEVARFWNKIGKKPNGFRFNDFEDNLFYKPSFERSGVMNLPGLIFGKGRDGNNAVLPAPYRNDYRIYKNHFKDRKKYLDTYGCYYVPATLEEEIYFPFPKNAGLSESLQDKLSDDICRKVSSLTGRNVEPQVSEHNSYSEAAYTLKRDSEYGTGMVVFTFDGKNPTNYYQISSEFADWSLKRLTVKELKKKYNDLKSGNRRKWDAYIDLISYDIVQEMNCIPWVLTKKPNYEMHLAIDVSEKHRYYDLSLMIQQEGMDFPFFINHVHPKTDNYKETINATFLEDGITKILREASSRIGSPLTAKSLLIYRDGKDCQKEFKTIKNIIPKLKEGGTLVPDLNWDYVEYRKSMTKKLRIYESNNGNAFNAPEGSFFDIHPTDWSIIATTGAGTLSQGTSSPISVKNTFTRGDLAKIREDLWLAAQYNYSSPTVAQRDSLPIKKADEALRDKMAQEVKGMRIK